MSLRNAADCGEEEGKQMERERERGGGGGGEVAKQGDTAAPGETQKPPLSHMGPARDGVPQVCACACVRECVCV
jgi:hypothetical protein